MGLCFTGGVTTGSKMNALKQTNQSLCIEAGATLKWAPCTTAYGTTDTITGQNVLKVSFRDAACWRSLAVAWFLFVKEVDILSGDG